MFGDVQAELVDSRHLQIRERRPFGRPRTFMVDVACLAPSFALQHPRAPAWLGLGVISALGAGAALYAALNDITPPLTTPLGVLLLGVALVSAVVFRVQSAATLVLATRHAGVPLLRIRPYRAGDADLAPFLDILQSRIAEAETRRGLDAERLRSGEIKTLRRLAGETVLSVSEYERAKQRVLLVAAGV